MNTHDFQQMLQSFSETLQTINSYLWGEYFLIPLLCGTGLYFSFRLKFVQVRKFTACCKQVFGNFSLSGDKAGKDGMSSFQALATAIAAQVGTGNMAGVATALVMGGPGSIFWMWVAAFCGMATIFAEAVLALLFKETDEENHVVGGPAYYISKGLGSKFLAGFFSVAIVIALGFIGTMVQANSIADAFFTAFSIPPLVMGVIVAILAGFVFFGGISRLAAVTEKLVPGMAIFYLLGCGYILIVHGDKLLSVIQLIIDSAFGVEAAVGGAAGASVKAAMRYGIARGLFSNEAGMGSTPHAHAVSKVDNPAQQGFAAIMGVFVTVIICTLSAFIVLATGVLDGSTTGIALTQKAFQIDYGAFGPIYVAIVLFFFAFSTIIGWFFFGEQNIKYLFGYRGVLPYRAIVLCFMIVGASLKVELVWELADFFNGLMVIPNLIALIGLSKLVAKVLEDYEHTPPSA